MYSHVLQTLWLLDCPAACEQHLGAASDKTALPPSHSDWRCESSHVLRLVQPVFLKFLSHIYLCHILHEQPKATPERKHWKELRIVISMYTVHCISPLYNNRCREVSSVVAHLSRICHECSSFLFSSNHSFNKVFPSF